MSHSPPPFTAGNVLRRALQVFLADAGRYLALVLLAFLPIAAIAVALPLLIRSASHELIARLFWPSFAVELLILVGFLVVLGASMHAAVESMRGRPVRIGASLAAALVRFWPLLATALVLVIGISMGFLLFMVPGMLFALAYYLALPIAVMERRGVIGSLRRAAALSSEHRSTLFNVGCCYLVTLIASNAAVRYGVAPLVRLVVGLSGTASIVSVVLLGLAALGVAVTVIAYQYVLTAVTYELLRREQPTDEDDTLSRVFA